MAELQRIVQVRPAYDCIAVQPCTRPHEQEQCNATAGQHHGRHNAEMHFVIRGPQAEITLAIGTGWSLPETPSAMRGESPWAYLVEFHSARPQYENHEPTGGPCELWTSCYIGRGYTMADEPTELLVRKGSDAVWEWLEAAYHDQFVAQAVRSNG